VSIDDNHEGVAKLERAMPQLRLETSLRGKRALGQLLGIHQRGEGATRQLADGFVRLVEKSALEYAAARERFLAYLAEGFADAYHRAQDHFESCIGSLHRAINYLERLRTIGFKSHDGSPFVPRPRDFELLKDGVDTRRSRIRELRDRFEHLDHDILSGRLPADADVSVHLAWDRGSIGDAFVTFAEVVTAIEDLHVFALNLASVVLRISWSFRALARRKAMSAGVGESMGFGENQIFELRRRRRSGVRVLVEVARRQPAH
jgi:hypothetical protein